MTAEVGRVTVGGVPAGVLTDGESREVALAAPGGYLWRPAAEQEVLLIRTGDGESLAVGAVCTGGTDGLDTGEVCIRTAGGETKLWLKKDGSIAVAGDVTLVGEAAVQGNVSVTGTVNITGSLLLNGVPIVPGV